MLEIVRHRTQTHPVTFYLGNITQVPAELIICPFKPGKQQTLTDLAILSAAGSLYHGPLRKMILTGTFQHGSIGLVIGNHSHHNGKFDHVAFIGYKDRGGIPEESAERISIVGCREVEIPILVAAALYKAAEANYESVTIPLWNCEEPNKQLVLQWMLQGIQLFLTPAVRMEISIVFADRKTAYSTF